MGALLDVLGSVIAGGIVIITIIFSILNIQRTNYTVQTMLSLNTAANRITETIDLDFFEHVGRNVEELGDVFGPVVNARMFQYRMNTQYNAPLAQQFLYTVQTVQDGNNIYLQVNQSFRSGTTWSAPAQRFSSAPFSFDSMDVFTYLDVNGNELVPPIADLTNIRGVRIDLVYVAPAYNAGELIQFPITFWRLFNNVYIAAGPPDP